MLTDTDLERLLAEAAGSFAVPEPVLDVPRVEKRVWQRRWPQAGAAAAVLVVGTLLLSPGGGVQGTTTASKSSAGGQTATGGTTGSGDALGPVAAPGLPPGARVPDALQVPVVGTTGTGASTATDTDGARVVKTGTLSLLVDEGKVSATLQRLQVIVAGLRGYVADSTSQESGKHPTASLTVRVPVASFDALRNQVRSMKATVLSEQVSGKDVTATYADTKAQIDSLTAARNRYLDILSRARTIAETLSVQQRVDDVQQQIDRLEGQRRVLADQSDYGTLTLTVAETKDEALVTKAPSGWSKAWDDAQHGFSSGVQRIIADSGRALLVLLVGAALLLLGRTGWRLARRRLV
jgi:hypothetical protein